MKKLKNIELNRISINEFKSAKKTPFIVVLDNIRSLNNIGAIFRTSDAFLVEKICLCGITATPPNKHIHKTALGSTESVEWEYFQNVDNLIKRLKKENVKIVVAEQVENSISLNKFFPEKNQKYAIVIGNEVKGVRDEVIKKSDFCLEIPQLGTKHSLNVSVVAAIVLWDLFVKINE